MTYRPGGISLRVSYDDPTSAEDAEIRRLALVLVPKKPATRSQANWCGILLLSAGALLALAALYNGNEVVYSPSRVLGSSSYSWSAPLLVVTGAFLIALLFLAAAMIIRRNSFRRRGRSIAAAIIDYNPSVLEIAEAVGRRDALLECGDNNDALELEAALETVYRQSTTREARRIVREP